MQPLSWPSLLQTASHLAIMRTIWSEWTRAWWSLELVWGSWSPITRTDLPCLIIFRTFWSEWTWSRWSPWLCAICPLSAQYSIRHRKRAFLKISVGTLLIFGLILESHNYSLAVSPTSLHSLWKGRRVNLVKKVISAEVERSKKKARKPFFVHFENHWFWTSQCS